MLNSMEHPQSKSFQREERSVDIINRLILYSTNFSQCLFVQPPKQCKKEQQETSKHRLEKGGFAPCNL